ncbi:hypothetical protein EON64_04590 [archaeon]|nr:MAG: hypothetical protein EON64_04590 [archaeon]
MISHYFEPTKRVVRRLRKQCLMEPPYIYATTHDEVPNVLKYTRDGCLISDEVLVGGPADQDHVTEFRSMALGSYLGQGDVLFIGDAMSQESFLLMYDTCNSHGQREYKGTVVSTEINPGADHTYGLAFDSDGNIYASFQHTDLVLRFQKDTFQPLPLPPALRSNKYWRDYFLGTVVQFGVPGVHRITEQGVRGITILGDDLWVANEDIGGVAVVSISTGVMHNIVVIRNPIGLFFDVDSGLLFVSSKDKHWRGGVFAIDPHLFRVVHTYSTMRMNHPSGITAYEGVLYVAELARGEILKFNVTSEKYLGTMVSDAPGEIEHLLLSPC